MTDFTPQGDIDLKGIYEVKNSSAGDTVGTSGIPIDDDFAKFTGAATIEGRSYSEVRTDLNIEDGADVTDATNVALAGAAMSGGAFHDGFSDFVANEHIDWTADQGATNIHPGNYTDTNTQLSESDITTMGFTKDVEVDWTVSQAPAVIHADNYTDTNTTYTSSDFDHNSLTNAHNLTTDIDHDALTNFAANEHIDWTADSVGTIHASNYVDNDTTYSAGDFNHDELANITGTAAQYNHPTDAQMTVIGNTSGTNTGDQAITPEGTAVKSTGEEGGTKYLREDGDGTCSWQTPAAGGDVTAAVNLTDETLVQGDGGAKGIKTTTVTAAEVALNTTDRHASGSDNQVAGDFAHNYLSGLNDGTDYEHITQTQKDALHAAVTLNASATTGGLSISTQEISHRAASNAQTGYATAAHIQAIEANTAKDTNVTTNITVVEAPTNVEIQSSDGSNDTIAAADETNAGVMTTAMYDEHVLAVAHYGDNTQAHSDYLLNSGADSAVGPITLTADNSTADQAYVPMVLYNTDDTPPAASGFPVGTIYIQYTA